MNRKENSLLFVVGARPNFIKIAPICMALRGEKNFPYQIVHTGQHYDEAMSDVFFKELAIPQPDFHLNIGSAGHGKQTGLIMAGIEQLCLEHPFSAMVVIGDVNSTLAGALVGAKSNIPVVHIESGLRSYNRSMPEEINRLATDHVSDLLFAPTQLAMDNLKKEGLEQLSHFSGDVMYDTMLHGLALAREKSRIMEQLNLDTKTYYLATLHRPYNVDEPDQLKAIMRGLSELQLPVILSAHPRLKKNLTQFGLSIGQNITITKPLGYLDFILLEQNAKKIITDSGGVQKEAFFVQTPCITLRPETEWVETINYGANVLVRERTTRAILEAVVQELKPRYEERPYGHGNSSEIIIDTIRYKFFT